MVKTLQKPETKKPEKPPALKRQNQLVSFFKEVTLESKKITWPSRKETSTSAAAVAIFTALMAIYLSVMDFLISFFISKRLF